MRTVYRISEGVLDRNAHWASLLLSLLNRNSSVDKQGRPGERGELSEWAQSFNTTATLSRLLFEGEENVLHYTECLVVASRQITRMPGRKRQTGFLTGEAALSCDKHVVAHSG